MDLKNFIGNQAHWNINKHLTKELGLNATLLLQHFIDLQSSFFKDGTFWQQQERICADLNMGTKPFRAARKVLADKGLISYKRGYEAKYYYTLHFNKILAMFEHTEMASSNMPNGNVGTCHDGTTHTNNKETNNKDTNSKWDVIYDKLIDGYPKNRIQSKNPVIKLLKQLDKEQIKLVLANKERYLKASNGYVKNLRKYIEEECWSEEWLNLQESANKSRNTGITNTKTFDNNYDDID